MNRVRFNLYLSREDRQTIKRLAAGRMSDAELIRRAIEVYGKLLAMNGDLMLRAKNGKLTQIILLGKG